jgi:hypothetical protein
MEKIRLEGGHGTAEEAREVAVGVTTALRLLVAELVALTFGGTVEALRERAPLLWNAKSLIDQASAVHEVLLEFWPELSRWCGELRSAIAAYEDASTNASARLMAAAGVLRLFRARRLSFPGAFIPVPRPGTRIVLPGAGGSRKGRPGHGGLTRLPGAESGGAGARGDRAGDRLGCSGGVGEDDHPCAGHHLAVLPGAIHRTRQPEAASRVMSFCPPACWLHLYRPSETMARMRVAPGRDRPGGQPLGDLAAKLAVAEPALRGRGRKSGGGHREYLPEKQGGNCGRARASP